MSAADPFAKEQVGKAAGRGKMGPCSSDINSGS